MISSYRYHLPDDVLPLVEHIAAQHTRGDLAPETCRLLRHISFAGYRLRRGDWVYFRAPDPALLPLSMEQLREAYDDVRLARVLKLLVTDDLELVAAIRRGELEDRVFRLRRWRHAAKQLLPPAAPTPAAIAA